MLLVGVLACLIGLIWMGQGTGYFPYPAQSFMIRQTPWVWRGGLMVLLGIITILRTRTR
jgi:hypothetical protein